MRETKTGGLVKGFGNSGNSGNNSALVISMSDREREIESVRVGEVRWDEERLLGLGFSESFKRDVSLV